MSLFANSEARTRNVVALFILISTLSFGIRLHALNQTEFANGWDAYFYLKQVTSISAHGRMHSEEWTLLYPLLIVFHYLLPDDITAIKVFSAFLAMVFTGLVVANAIALRLNFVSVFAVSSLALWSPELTYFAAQWPKNLLGVNILLLLLLALQLGKRGWAVFFLVIGLFGHRMTAVLSIIATAVWFVSMKLERRTAMIVALAAMVLMAGGWAFKGVLNVHDVGRLENFIRFSPQLPITSFYQLFGIDKVSWLWKTELTVVFGLSVVLISLLIYRSIKSKKAERFAVLLVVVMIVLWFPFYHWDLAGAAYRFFHVGALMSPFLLMAILRWYPVPPTAAIALSSFLLFSSFYSWRSYRPERHDPPYVVYQHLTAKAHSSWPEQHQPELVIAHKALAEYFSFTTGIDAMSWRPEYYIKPEKLQRIAVLPYSKLFEHYMGFRPLSLGGDYVLIREERWQQFLQNVKEHEPSALYDELTDWKNPSALRPTFLKK